MSKIGNYNMELEEEFRDQLNKLGFETLQDALNAGWEMLPLLDPVTGETSHYLQRIDATKFFVNDSVSLTDEAYEQAQKDWEKEKEEALTILNTLNFDIEFTNLGVSVINKYHEMIDGVIQFVEKARF